MLEREREEMKLVVSSAVLRIPVLRIRIRPDPHKFGPLDPDPHGTKMLDPDP